MNVSGHCSTRRGFTLIELLLVFAVISVLAALILSALAKGKPRARQAQCLSHLKQVGSAFHAFAHDHKNTFPMNLSTNEGGGAETWAQGGPDERLRGSSMYRFFQALSNDLVTPEVLICPSDRGRLAAREFSLMSNSNLSYCAFFSTPTCPSGMDYPDTILSSDWNIRGSKGGIGSEALSWTEDVHQRRGNILFCDGHVEQLLNAQLLAAIPDNWPGALRPGAGKALTAGDPAGLASSAPAPSGASRRSSGTRAVDAASAAAPSSAGYSGAAVPREQGLFQQVQSAMDSTAPTYSRRPATPSPGNIAAYSTAIDGSRSIETKRPGVKADVAIHVAASTTGRPIPRIAQPTLLPPTDNFTPPGYIIIKDPRNRWLLFLIALVLILAIEILRRHRGRSKRGVSRNAPY